MTILVASFGCGFVFGIGLLLSGMAQPAKVLNFLDVFGTWDPSLAVVMAAALIVSALGYGWAKRLQRPILAPKIFWPARTDIDRPLLLGSALFGIGWGLAGLCPGPALVDIATLSPKLLVFVLAMGAGIVIHDWWRAQSAPAQKEATVATDG